MNLEIAIRQPLGRCKGLVVPMALDAIFITPPDGRAREVGWVHRAPNSMVHFTRYLDVDLRAVIRDRVAELRDQAGLPTVHELTSSVPNPKLVRAYLQGELPRRKKKTVFTGGTDADEGNAARGGAAADDDGGN